jgi:hypothetical protein
MKEDEKAKHVVRFGGGGMENVYIVLIREDEVNRDNVWDIVIC